MSLSHCPRCVFRRWRHAIRALCSSERDGGSFSFTSSPDQSEHLLTLHSWLEWYTQHIRTTNVLSHSCMFSHPLCYSYHILSFESILVELGAVSPIDLLDLTPLEVSSLHMKSLEARRWERLMKRLQQSPSTYPCRAVLPITEDDTDVEVAAEIVKHAKHPQVADSIDSIKEVVWATKYFRLNMDLWDRELLGYILDQISDFMSSKSHTVNSFARLLDGLQDGPLLEALLAEMLRYVVNIVVVLNMHASLTLLYIKIEKHLSLSLFLLKYILTCVLICVSVAAMRISYTPAVREPSTCASPQASGCSRTRSKWCKKLGVAWNGVQTR